MPGDTLACAIVTFGCRVNQADSLQIENDFRQQGVRVVPVDQADVVVVNTCSVTASADQAARQTIRRIGRTNPEVRIVVTGCYASRCEGEVAALPNVVRVVPNTRKDALARDVAPDLDLTTRERFGGGEGACGLTLSPGAAGRTAFTLRVQTGCGAVCSYCIIPTTRGRSRSKPVAEVLGDVNRAIAAGYKEIAITGVHLGSYGRDLAGKCSLTVLIQQLARIDADIVFRLSSLEPMDCTPEIIDAVASSRRFAPHFHLPLQHGADDVLRAMNRPYTAAYYRDLVHGIHRRLPHASIGSDIIVGFPGETTVHFDAMRSLLEDLPLAYLHVFPYSDRPGTAATRLRLKVPGPEIRRRAGEIRAMGEHMTDRFRRSQIGTVVRALTVDDGRAAVSGNYLKLKLTTARPRNEWVVLRVAPGMVGQAEMQPSPIS